MSSWTVGVSLVNVIGTVKLTLTWLFLSNRTDRQADNYRQPAFAGPQWMDVKIWQIYGYYMCSTCFWNVTLNLKFKCQIYNLSFKDFCE